MIAVNKLSEGRNWLWPQKLDRVLPWPDPNMHMSYTFLLNQHVVTWKHASGVIMVKRCVCVCLEPRVECSGLARTIKSPAYHSIREYQQPGDTYLAVFLISCGVR